MNLKLHTQLKNRANLERRRNVEFKEAVNDTYFPLEGTLESKNRYRTILTPFTGIGILGTMQRQLEQGIFRNSGILVLAAGIDFKCCTGIQIDDINAQMHAETEFHGKDRPFSSIKDRNGSLDSNPSDKTKIKGSVKTCLESILVDEDINRSLHLHDTGNHDMYRTRKMKTLLWQIGRLIHAWRDHLTCIDPIDLFQLKNTFIILCCVDLKQE